MSAYRAFVVKESNGSFSGEIVMENVRNLPPGEVLIKVKYSCINHFDVLAATEERKGAKPYPWVFGIDAAGIVAESSSGTFRKGDEVIVTGYGLGNAVPGGFGQYIRVPAAWVMSLPTGLSLKDSMIIGTEGLAAAIAVMEMRAAGMPDEDKNILVTGAAFGTGAFAVAILNRSGYRVTAVTSQRDTDDFILRLGAKEVIESEKFKDHSDSSLLPDKYISAIDTLGGEVLDAALKSVRSNGSVAVCGMIDSRNFSSSILPLVFRGVNILGVDSINCSMSIKSEAWYKLAGEWYLKVLPWLCAEISLMEIETYMEKIIKGELKGRAVINHDI